MQWTHVRVRVPRRFLKGVPEIHGRRENEGLACNQFMSIPGISVLFTGDHRR